MLGSQTNYELSNKSLSSKYKYVSYSYFIHQKLLLAEYVFDIKGFLFPSHTNLKFIHLIFEQILIWCSQFFLFFILKRNFGTTEILDYSRSYNLICMVTSIVGLLHIRCELRYYIITNRNMYPQSWPHSQFMKAKYSKCIRYFEM